MTIESTPQGLRVTAIEDPGDTTTARLMALKAAVRLEAVGMRHSSGRSMRRVACRELGLRANTGHDDVIGALAKEIEKRLKARPRLACPNCKETDFLRPTLPRDHHTHWCENCCVHFTPPGATK